MSFFTTDAGRNTIGAGINSLLSLGVTAVGANQDRKLLAGQANISAQQNQTAIEVERERTRQAQLNLEASRAKAPESGSKALYIGLAIGGVVILGGIIFAVTRK
jgi:hypothetical protein